MHEPPAEPFAATLDDVLGAFRRRTVGNLPQIDDLLPPLWQAGQVRRLARGQLFVALGGESHLAGISGDGYFRNYLIDSKGTEVTLGFHRPGEIVASYSSLVRRVPSQLAIECLNDCTVLVLDARTLSRLIQADLRWFRVLFGLLQSQYFIKDERTLAFLIQDARARYETFCTEYRDLEGLLKNYQIATYLGVTPETLSRIRRARASLPTPSRSLDLHQ